MSQFPSQPAKQLLSAKFQNSSAALGIRQDATSGTPAKNSLTWLYLALLSLTLPCLLCLTLPLFNLLNFQLAPAFWEGFIAINGSHSHPGTGQKTMERSYHSSSPAPVLWPPLQGGTGRRCSRVKPNLTVIVLSPPQPLDGLKVFLSIPFIMLKTIL